MKTTKCTHCHEVVDPTDYDQVTAQGCGETSYIHINCVFKVLDQINGLNRAPALIAERERFFAQPNKE